jgi:hypothetical protein
MEEHTALRIPRLPVESSSLASVGYDDGRRILAIEFRSGEIFHYSDIDADLALELVHAPSIGTFYHMRIRGQFHGAKMTGICPLCAHKPGWIGDSCTECGGQNGGRYVEEIR